MTTPRGAGRIRHRVRVVGVAALAALVLGAVVFGVWGNTPMRAETSGVIAVERDHRVTLSSSDNRIVMRPASGGNGTGLLFYPGARVDPYAYLATLDGVARRGTTVVIAEVPLDLAFFDTRSVATLTNGIRGIDRWYVGGHSLGGVRACQVATQPHVTGLILFGSYCANDLSSSTLRVLSVTGSRDGLAGPAVAEAHADDLPDTTRFVTIQGSNHARFGDYGHQPGDGTATISRATSTAALTQTLVHFLG